ncbi:ECF-type sigma factor [Altererythrobacter sp. KTW20L]|uniref:ECF-type sigma factor n=1 Tax=Altererythrobacter sp. KTW20L TaxID=2942210 RepID=UPI0020BFE10E|nr:ECF-type sigma factor [Altererythrobacter sp. KTW20L]MCL6251543.1 ECF-type sigma factor [Altererythrobacter sp. KTW20L]
MTAKVELCHYANLWRDGDAAAGDRLFAELDCDLRRIAEARLFGERNFSLSAGELVNEAVIRLAGLDRIVWKSNAHILALASTIMRQVLLDHVRRKNSQKRWHEVVTLCTDVAHLEPNFELIALNMAMEELAEIDPQRADIVEMRYFGGMSLTSIGEVLGLSEATVKRRWVVTRAWLQDRLENS